MEVTILSTDIIKPSSPSIKNNKPHKLCLFDQLFPLTYITGVLFYPNIVSSDPNNLTTLSQALAHLKKSLSETLNLYYPFSGRIKNNAYVDDFDSGVPFSVATVSFRMKDYFKLNDPELNNKLVLFPPFRREAGGKTPIPLLGFQANVFSCGAVALGISLCHTLADGISMFYLMSSWAAFSRTVPNDVITPSFFSEASVLFPAEKDLPPETYLIPIEKMMFQVGSYVTRTFVFSEKVLEALQEKASSERFMKPTRNDALSCFIWKHATESAFSSSEYGGSISLAHQTVNIRARFKSQNPVGNLFWTATAVAPAIMDLPELAGQMKGAMEEYESVFDALAEQGYAEGSGSKALWRNIERVGSLQEQLGVRPFELRFTNWKGFFNDIDYGWGKPFKVGAVGKPGPAFMNLVVLNDSQRGKGMEATVILEEELMAVLERDVNFLAFASPNQGISSL